MSQLNLSDEVSQCNFEPAEDLLQEMDAYDDCSNKDDDHKILLDDDEIPWKISIYPPPGRNLQRLVAWQIERHIQWINNSDYKDREYLTDCQSKDKGFFCSTFRMCTAKDLKNKKPFNDGNLGIKIARTEAYHGTMDNDGDGELKDCPWGRPAAALLVAARSHCNNPGDWMLLDEPRKLLIAMEKWYFELAEPKQQSLAKNAWSWTEMQEAEKIKWNQAFSVCGCGKGKRCRKSRWESEGTD
ncbi:feruloyl esterase B precursor [Penicillium sp. IBT 35674x]|nr:feruloyl esterase B precursor [Penicillium sp. IBT 35674x]